MATTQQQRTGAAYIRPEIMALLYAYDLIRDCIAGSKAVKDRGDFYLPRPNEADTSPANRMRFRNYIKRAVFYNNLRRTIFGMVGQIFLRDPQIEVPTGLQVLMADANGEGATLQQLMAQSCNFVLAYGRAGVFTDFPAPPLTTVTDAMGKPVPQYSPAELAEGDVRPVLRTYPSRQIINWRKAMRGARQVYTLIVVENMFYTTKDGFDIKAEQEFMVLKLLTADQAMTEMATPQESDTVNYTEVMNWSVNSDVTDVYKIEIWRKSNRDTTYYVQRFFPQDHNGKFINEIPFDFINSDKNDDACPEPPVYDIAELNIAHYRNSADYEEAVYVAGQPTVVVSGITEEWAKNILKNGVAMGSRGVIPLPVGGNAQILQAQANSLPKEAMDTKEKQMIALGAKLVETRPVPISATQAALDSTAESTILGSIAKNVAAAYTSACKRACIYTGDDPDSVNVNLNTEFDLTKMDPQERFELISEWMNGAITFSEMRANLRRGGVATLPDAEAQTQLAKEAAQRQELAMQNAKDMAAALPQPVQPANPGEAVKPGEKPKTPVPGQKQDGGKSPAQPS